MQEYLGEISRIDDLNDAFTPQLQPDSISEETPRGTLELDTLLRRSFHHVVFSVKDFPDIGILYRHDCVANQTLALSPHPVILDAIFTREADALGLTRDFLFISPPVPLWFDTTSAKVMFDMTDEEFFDCALAGGSVRYTVMELFGDDRVVPVSLVKQSEFFTHAKKKFATAFRLGYILIRQLQRLHAHNIVHGDLDPSRLILERVPGHDFPRLQFVPFSAASWVDDSTGISRDTQAWKYTPLAECSGRLRLFRG